MTVFRISNYAWLMSLLTALLFLSSCSKLLKWPDEGVPIGLAEQRSALIDSLSYELFFSIPASPDSSLGGSVIITFHLDSLPHKGIYLDFAGDLPKTALVEANRRRIRVHHQNQHILIPSKYLHTGRNEVALDGFVPSDDALNRNPGYMYTLFVPDKARTAFPCFDQPDLKASFHLFLDLPYSWTPVTNTNIESEPVSMDHDRTTWSFAYTKPLSTYLFAFAAGEFQVVQTPFEGRMVRFYHREPDSALVAHNARQLFRLHEESIAWLESYTGIEYPFSKFDFVILPAFQYSGMEHPGCIYYNARRLFLTKSAGISEKLRRASLIAHETAHMWFGDLVTMRWFDDVWMKEVFANFMAAKIVNPEFPEIDHEARFILTHYPRAYAVDRTAGANPIKQDLENLQDAGSLYGDIIYYKAPILMRQLEFMTGVKPFRDALREYLGSYSYGSASWEDLIGILDERSEYDIRTWSQQWFLKSGMPSYEISPVANQLEFDADDIKWWRVAPADSMAMGALQVFSLIDLSTGDVVEKQVTLNGPDGLMLGQGHPRVLFHDGRFYGFHSISGNQVPEYIELACSQPRVSTRSSAWITLHENFLRGNIGHQAYWDGLIEAIRQERSPILLAYLLDITEEYYWHYLPGDLMEASIELEEVLLTKSAEKGSTRICLETYARTALSSHATDSLARWWRYGLPGVWTGPEDELLLLGALALRDWDGIDKAYYTQLGRMDNPDMVARLEYLHDVITRDSTRWGAFARSLGDQAMRAHEPWLLEGLQLLHHPLRAEHSIQFLGMHLALLEEVRTTGDIFLPRNWLEASLGQYRSPEAAHIAREYLGAHTDLDPRLRGKLLQAAYHLFNQESMAKRLAPA